MYVCFVFFTLCTCRSNFSRPPIQACLDRRITVDQFSLNPDELLMSTFYFFKQMDESFMMDFFFSSSHRPPPSNEFVCVLFFFQDIDMISTYSSGRRKRLPDTVTLLL